MWVLMCVIVYIYKCIFYVERFICTIANVIQECNTS